MYVVEAIVRRIMDGDTVAFEFGGRPLAAPQVRWHGRQN